MSSTRVATEAVQPGLSPSLKTGSEKPATPEHSIRIATAGLTPPQLSHFHSIIFLTGFDNRGAILIDCDPNMHGTTAYFAVLYVRLLASRPIHE